MYAGMPLLPEILMLVGVLFVFLAATMAWRRKRRWTSGVRPQGAVRPRVSDSPRRSRQAEVAQRREGGANRENKAYAEWEPRRRTIRGKDEGTWETQRGSDRGDGAGAKPSA
jgi:hypothetical protein